MKFLEMLWAIIKTKQVYVPVISFILGYLFCKLINAGLNKMFRPGKSDYEAKKRKTAQKLISNITKYIIVVIVVIIDLDAYGFDTASIIAGLGVASAVIGLAFQDTLKDFICGVTIILENYYVVGDYVTYNGFTGEVVELGLKSTKIRNAAGETMIVANRNIVEIINLSQERANVILKPTVAYEESTEKVEKVINELLPKLNKINMVINNSATYLGVDNLGDSAVTYAIKVTCKQDNQWQVKRDALKIIKDEFEKNNIKIPYPQLEVHHGQDI